ncbi:MAG: hypothetical protein U5R31_12890 [Acidimicrobiia bacterium]|nr:hypothetical protein [Acidimicrobiia bacterium]
MHNPLFVGQIEATQRDARVLDLLRNELAAFDLQLSSTEKVVKRVAGLVADLQDIDIGTVEELRQIWWPVEFMFALSVDEERPLTDEELLAQLRDAVLALEGRDSGPAPT